jgi:hypothetical protein
MARRTSLETLMEVAMNKPDNQYIFLSPLDLGVRAGAMRGAQGCAHMGSAWASCARRSEL